MIEVLEEKFIIDTELSHLRAHEDTISDVMLKAANSHDNETDHFSPLGQDTSENPYQRADCTVALGKAASIDKFRELAPLIYPDFEKSVDRLMDTRDDALTHMSDILANDHDVNTMTDHRNVVGVAVGSSIVAAALYESGKVDHGDIETQIAVSGMLKYIRIMGIPAIPLIQDVFSRTNIVFPSINKANRDQLPENVADDFNARSNQSRNYGKKKPTLVAIAGSATRDVKVHNPLLPASRKNGYYMGPPSNGTVEEYMTNTYIFDMGLDMAKGDKGVFFGKMWLPTDDASRPAVIMKHIANGMSETTGVKSHFISDWNEFRALKMAHR